MLEMGGEMEDLMSETQNQSKLVGLWLVGLWALLSIGAFFAAFESWLFLRLPGSDRFQTITVEIAPGTNAMSVATQLHAEGVIADPPAFYWLCRIRGKAQRLQAGEYAFAVPMTPDQVLEKLVEGKVLLHRITLPEGSTLRDVAKALGSESLVQEADVWNLVHDRAFIQSLGLDLPSLEGYLFPETYHFSKNLNAGTILKSMVHQFKQHFTDKMAQQASEMRMSMHQVVILASMVEKETAVESERPLVAAVFLNRLRRDMRLQSDPTAVYDLEGFSGPVRPDHLKRQSPYNTYQIKGLPAGPICNPGLRSLQAVLQSATVPYLYFVSNNDGTHRFSTTIEEHQQAVSHYREKVRKAGLGETKSESTPNPPAGDNNTASKTQTQE
jgi:UPF0755 protein